LWLRGKKLLDETQEALRSPQKAGQVAGTLREKFRTSRAVNHGIKVGKRQAQYLFGLLCGYLMLRGHDLDC
jgi:hypothetical protein